MGNRIVIQVDDEGTSVVLAHLQRGSARVAVGDEVTAGQVIAAVGNSGNTSEPHVHLQVVDDPRPNRALGVPFTFTDVVVSDSVTTPAASSPPAVVPRNDAIFHGGIDLTTGPGATSSPRGAAPAMAPARRYGGDEVIS